VRAVEELRAGAGAEHTRRRELEAALRESAAIFKRELHDKNLELAALQQQLGSVAHLCTSQPCGHKSKTEMALSPGQFCCQWLMHSFVFC